MKTNLFYSFITPKYKWEFVPATEYKMTANRRLYNALRGTEVPLICKGSTFGYNVSINGIQRFFSTIQFNKNIKQIV